MKNRLNVQASILDRLIDREPDVFAEPVQEFSVGRIKDGVARDLENLLNTRRTIIPVPSSFKEVSDSLFLYGLPDFTSSNPANVSVRSKLRLEIEKIITRFEPRLKNVAVHIDSPAGTGRELRFRISAVLVVDPIAEPVVFDTRYDFQRSQYSIVK